QFREAELRTGSVIRGTRQSAKRGTAVTAGSSRFKGAPFLTFRNGLSSIVEALERELADAECRRGRRVVRLLAAPAAAAKPDEVQAARYAVQLDDGESLPADVVVMTAPAYDAAPILAPHIDVSM